MQSEYQRKVKEVELEAENSKFPFVVKAGAYKALYEHAFEMSEIYKKHLENAERLIESYKLIIESKNESIKILTKIAKS